MHFLTGTDRVQNIAWCFQVLMTKNQPPKLSCAERPHFSFTKFSRSGQTNTSTVRVTECMKQICGPWWHDSDPNFQVHISTLVQRPQHAMSNWSKSSPAISCTIRFWSFALQILYRNHRLRLRSKKHQATPGETYAASCRCGYHFSRLDFRKLKTSKIFV